VDEKFLYDAAEWSRLGGGHGKHDNAHNIGPLRPRARLRFVEEDEDETLAISNLCDALLPPGEEFLVG
jgi:hypothetical protein